MLNDRNVTRFLDALSTNFAGVRSHPLDEKKAFAF